MRDLAQTRPYGEAVAGVIDEEVKAIVDECYVRARKMIVDNLQVLHKCAAILVEKEKMYREEFEALFTL